jgi:small subunit ribosomal protein S17
MTDAENKENIEETAEAPEEAAPEAPEDSPAEAPEAAAEEAPADGAPAEETPAEEAAAPAPAAEADDAEPEASLSPKERRKRTRSQHAGTARPPRSQEERTAERLERRRKKAVERRAWRVKSRERRRATSSGQGTPPAERETTGSARIRQGIVVSDKADKTITVRIDVARRHRTYKKIVRSSSTLHAHDERNEAGAGDTVRIVESRPLSRTKRWRLVEIVERAR